MSSQTSGLTKSIQKPLTSLIFTAAYLLTSNSHASFEKAMETYSAGHFEKAKVAFETMASIGDSSSLFNLGVMHYRGEAVKQDSVKAYVLMKIANESVNVESFSKTAQAVYSSLDNTQKSYAKDLYSEIIEIYGHKNIEANIFPSLLDDKDCPPDLKPISRGVAVYPKSELVNGKLGLVHTELTVSPEGYPREVNITSSTSKAFSKATLKAFEAYIYPPSLNGKPKIERTVTIYKIDIQKGDTFRTKAVSEKLNTLKEKSEGGDAVAQFLYGRDLNTYRYFDDYLVDEKFQYKEANKWYAKSASSGIVNAQFEIGRNMLEGRGCKVDTENGFKWIKASAVGGYSPAQKYLATSELAGESITGNSSKSIISWLRNAVQDEQRNYSSKLLLAWELVSSPEKSLLNPDEALELIKNKPLEFSDKIRILETKAAAFAQKNNFKKAVKFQTKAANLAQKKKWTIPKIMERLNLYEQNQTYIGRYY